MVVGVRKESTGTVTSNEAGWKMALRLAFRHIALRFSATALSAPNGIALFRFDALREKKPGVL